MAEEILGESYNIYLDSTTCVLDIITNRPHLCDNGGINHTATMRYLQSVDYREVQNYRQLN